MFRAAILVALSLILAPLAAVPADAQRNGNGNGAGNGNGNGGQPPVCDRNMQVAGKNPNCNLEPVLLTVETDIDFGRLVLVGNGIGRVVLDLDSGTKLTFGGIDDLGGFAVKGRALVTGEPNRAVMIDLPNNVLMADPAGGTAELRDIVTNLTSLPLLDTNGQLTFEFSGTLYTDTNTAVGGLLRGRIPISVQYN